MSAAEPAKPQNAPETEAVRGVEHDPGKKWTVYQMGMCVAALALAGMYPAVMDVVRNLRDLDSQGVESWALLVFLLSGMQLVYALYMVQLPDWSTTWVVMIVSAIVSVVYAIGLGVALMADGENPILAALGLAGVQSAGYLSLWCFMMTLLSSLLTYFLIRATLKWRRTYELATAGR